MRTCAFESSEFVAKSAGVSVGLLYKYFSDKEQILLAAITRVLGAFRDRVPQAIEGIDDPVVRVTEAFAEFCRAVDDHRHAVVLTYRESRSLSREGLADIQRQELETLGPLVDAVRGAADSGDLREVPPELFAYDLLVLAHTWALKHWYFHARGLSVDEYVEQQVRTVVLGALTDAARSRVER
ncbi:MAG: TetR/AcrR family transcriptional regulator [Brevibacterium yomogidense]|uniref:TetR/AcrR family transcriptional regulator n=1 Tax=Brevibacterium sp. Mu109 TaxID=1255669 RepID=UPI0015E0D359|nr:TetR/AcrR family transcriptional regulator [Brevibacterium sp. Mu109]